MVSEIIHTLVPSGGGDYTLLSAWEAAQQAELTNTTTFPPDGAIKRIRCHSGSITDQCTMSGWTTDATRYPVIEAAAGHEHGGIPGAGFKITNNTSTITITTPIAVLRVSGIAIGNSSTGNAISAGSGNTQLWVQGCLIGPTGGSGISAAVPSTLFVSNNIFFDITSSGITLNSSTPTCHAYNNTIIGGDNGIRQAAGTMRPKNNVVQGAATACFTGTMTASATNLSSDATSPEAGLRSITLDFADAGADDYHLAATDTEAIGAGTDLSADATMPLSTDIDGDVRTGAWDIGADQRVAGAVYTQASYRLYADDGIGLGAPP